MGACFGKKKKELSQSDFNFLLENTEFNAHQIKDWYRGFMEDCPKGELTKNEFVKLYKQFFPTGDAHSFCEHIFRTFDVDRSGKIDFKEFLIAINITSKCDPKRKLTWAFKMYDIDGNGVIEFEEMQRLIRSIYELTNVSSQSEADNRARAIFEAMDADNDGQITETEFLNGCLNEKLIIDKLSKPQ